MTPWEANPIIDLESLLGHRPHPLRLSYGTAGFRSRASNLHEAVLRCGALAACRSHVLDGRATGVMVTASHNPASDNGVKLIEPDGSMLDAAWEKAATGFINATNNATGSLKHLVNVDEVAKERKSRVVIGWDTRESAETLVDLVKQGVEAVGGNVEMFGCVTTPQLHFHLRARDRGEKCGLEDYYGGLVKAYKEMVKGKQCAVDALAVDCACGVGAGAVGAIAEILPVTVVNRPEEGVLNEGCGADFVQKQGVMPKVYGREVGCRIWGSLDGDADRLVMFARKEGGVVVADGDRFATLLAMFVAELVEKGGVELCIGVAQTAYSNGAATEFLNGLRGVEVLIAKTGVKHLEKAVKEFDVGIYWEPNGHGTVLFSDNAVRVITDALENADGEQKEILKQLLAVGNLANQAVGDGVADLLLVIAVLSVKGMTFDDWLHMYVQRSSANLVVQVADKSLIQTEDCDRIVKTPPQVASAITKLTTQPGTRAFVRPSGTEDVVRIYAESPPSHPHLAAEIAQTLAQIIQTTCTPNKQ